MVWLYTLISVVIVSLVSLSGVITLAINKNFLKKILLILVAFSTGALLGDAFLHLLPEIIEESNQLSLSATLMIFCGILLFFILEKILRWRHCHDIDCKEHPKHLGIMNLVGDAVHNFIDGVLIGASFLVSIPLGVATTIAVAAHEIPQELGDFGVLLHSGFKPAQAIWYNILSACTAILGAICVLILGNFSNNLVDAMIPLTAGGFIYIALSGLVPELHKEQKMSISLIQLVAIICGIALMYLLLHLE